MSLKTKFWLWVGTVYPALGIMAWQLWAVNIWYFIVAEVFILFSLVVFFLFQRSLLGPFQALSRGAKLLEEQDFNTRLVPVGQKEVDQLTSVYNRMVDALRQERLRQEEAHFFLKKLIDASPQSILILDFDDKIREANPAAQILLGKQTQDITGLDIADVSGKWCGILNSLRKPMRQMIRMEGGKSFRLERAVFMDRGFERPFITIEEQTREIMILERQAYEKLIRMMSHEVNNSAGAINSLLNSVLDDVDLLPPEEREEYRSALSICIKRNEHLSAFMSNLAGVIKLPAPQKLKTDLHELLEGILRLMDARCKEHEIEIVKYFDSEPLHVLLDPVQMEQVFVNILKNAIEAIGEKGCIEIHTSNQSESLRIRNNGVPISPEERTKLFTPFYSSKKHGQGVGLTLAREVLSRHAFGFRLETCPDGFTEFEVLF